MMAQTSMLHRLLQHRIWGIIVIVIGVLTKGESVAAQGLSAFCSTATNTQGEVVPVTIVRTISAQEFPLLYWNPTYFSADGRSPQSYCEKATMILQEAFDDDDRWFIKTSELDSVEVLCVTDDADDRCRQSTILATLSASVDRYEALAHLLDLDRLSDRTPLYFTDDLVTYVDREAVVNINVVFDIVEESDASDTNSYTNDSNSSNPSLDPSDNHELGESNNENR